MVKTSPFNVGGRGMGLILDQGAKIPCTLHQKRKRKENRSNIVTNYIKAF